MFSAMKHVVWILLLASVAFADEPVDIAELAALLKSDDPQEAAQAARSLGELGEEAVSAAPQLVAALSDERTEYKGTLMTVALAASHALVAIGSPTVPELLDALNSASDQYARCRVASTLGAIDPPAEVALPRLKTIIEDDDEVERLRFNALMAYCSINTSNDERMATLEKVFHTFSSEFRGFSAMNLGASGKKAAFAVPVLMTGLDDDARFRYLISNHFGMEQSVRQACIDALGNIGPAAITAKGPLLEIMRGDTNDRIAAALSVSQIDSGNDEAMEFLIAQLNVRNEDNIFFGSSLHAAGALAQLTPYDDRAVTALASALEYPDEDYREEIVRDIGNVKDRAVVPLLIKTLKGDDSLDDYTAREVAAESLGELGKLAAPAVPDLVRALYDNFPTKSTTSRNSIFWEATTALGKIGPAAKSALDDLKLIQRSLDKEDLKELVTKTIERIETVE